MRSLAAASLLLGLGHAAASSCPTKILDPYMDEVSPFGWPMAPGEWDFAHADCWEEKYLLCGGSRQSPLALDFRDADASCKPQVKGATGLLASHAAYQIVADNPQVSVSGYMRTVKVDGNFGSLMLKDSEGKNVEYQATQVHLTADSLHSVNGTHSPAEMLIIHQPQGASNALEGSVIVSAMFKEGASSGLFTQMGLDAERSVGQAAWAAPRSIDLQAAMSSPLSGDSYSYQGSVPVPPCSENVQYIVLAAPLEASAAQIGKLKALLEEHAGGSAKRPPVERVHSGSTCRPVAMNSDLREKDGRPSACASAEGDDAERSVACWTSTCGISPIDVKTYEADRSLATVAASEIMHYEPAEHVSVKPSMYTLDATVHGGDFGHLMVNGHKFVATKISIKPISAHTINGKRFAGELMIEHELSSPGENGDAAGHRRLAEAAHTPDADGHHSGADGEPKQVIVSVPLELGAESPLLRVLELGSDLHAAAIKDGNGYDVHGPIDVAAGIAASTGGDWYWYHGSHLHGHSCSAFGARWMVFSRPLTVSLQQLNSLHLSVSGVDSSPAAGGEGQVFASAVPADAAEVNGTCGTDGWSYQKPSCWGAVSETCGSGAAQSPINVETAAVAKVGNEKFLHKTSWKPVTGLRAQGMGHALGARSQMFGYITVIGSNGFPDYYQVTGFDLKMPSEHLIDGHQFAAELQVRHKMQIYVGELSDSELVTTSFMFEVGAESKLLKQVMGDHAPAAGTFSEIKAPVDLMWALGPALDGDFYSYDGSLTTPGCDETVKWVLFSQVQTLSAAQLAAFKAAYGSTNRPVQKLNGRKVVKNSLEEGDPIDYRYFLDRDAGRDRLTPDVGLVAVPIVGTVILLTIVSAAMWVREETKRKGQSAGGLEPSPTTVGRSGYGRM